MKKYKYIAVDSAGKRSRGVFVADDQSELEAWLERGGLTLKACRQLHGGTGVSFAVTKTGAAELSAFCRQFSVMLAAGVDPVEVLKDLKEQRYGFSLRRAVARICDDVNGGESLSSAMARHPSVFPPIMLSMVGVGELSASLGQIFSDLADYFKAQGALRQKTVDALAYPAVLICMVFVLVAVMVALVVPAFLQAFAALGADVPPYLLALDRAGSFIGTYWPFILLGLVLLAVALKLLFSCKRVRFAADAFRYKAPLVGGITVRLVTARFARAFASLLDSGLDVLSALNAVRSVLSNRYAERRFDRAVAAVANGAPLAEAFGGQKIFHRCLIQMVRVGERGGALSQSLLHACGRCESEAEDRLNKLVSSVQPVLILAIAAAVVLMFCALYAPLVQMIGSNGIL